MSSVTSKSHTSFGLTLPQPHVEKKWYLVYDTGEPSLDHQMHSMMEKFLHSPYLLEEFKAEKVAGYFYLKCIYLATETNRRGIYTNDGSIRCDFGQQFSLKYISRSNLWCRWSDASGTHSCKIVA